MCWTGLMHHGTSLRIGTHYTDTGGASDHVFILCAMLGFRFCPRLRDLHDRKLAAIEPATAYKDLAPLLGRRVKADVIREHWGEILRPVISLQASTVLPSAMLRRPPDLRPHPLTSGKAGIIAYIKPIHAKRIFRRAILSIAFAGGGTGCYRAMIRTHSRLRTSSVMSGKCRSSSRMADSSPPSSNTRRIATAVFSSIQNIASS